MSTGATVRGLVSACHPGPTAVVTALSAALLLGTGATARTALLATAAVLTGQLSIGWSNDWLDAGRDATAVRRDKPSVRGVVSVALLRAVAVVAAVLCVALSLATGVRPGLVHLVAVAVAWAYNLRLKDSVWSWAPYAVSFGLLPVFLVMTLPGQPLAAAWAVGCAAFLGTGAHVANVLPDLEDDAATGVRGLPHRIGRRRSGQLAPALLVVGVAFGVLGTLHAPGGLPALGVIGVGAVAAVLAVDAGVLAVTRPRSRAPFGLSMTVAGLCVLLLVFSGSSLVSA
ncbi:UbiA family prenyltransferase [Actinotalea sp.]|uniref:UbiA family prenyltransferase n=1 Tax=Actinotalea sp. TaxID=1872145 RepID=UPI0035684F2E